MNQSDACCLNKDWEKGCKKIMTKAIACKGKSNSQSVFYREVTGNIVGNSASNFSLSRIIAGLDGGV